MSVLRFAALALCLSPLPALAAPVTYVCALEVPRKENWIPRQVIIVHDAAKGQVTVNDPIIQHYHGVPVTGRVDTDNARRITFKWELEMVRNGSNQVAPKLAYRATVQKATQAVGVAMQAHGYSNSFRAEGQCKRQ